MYVFLYHLFYDDLDDVDISNNNDDADYTEFLNVFNAKIIIFTSCEYEHGLDEIFNDQYLKTIKIYLWYQWLQCFKWRETIKI